MVMAERIDYQIEKYRFTELSESPRLARQWADVLGECRQEKLGSEARLRFALLNVDYVTSFELPFRLLLLRTPQYIAHIRNLLALNQKTVTINGRKRGRVYSIKADLSTVPDEFRYRFSSRIRRVSAGGITTNPFPEIARQTKVPRERLRLALDAGLEVNALDGLFWLGSQRIAADIAVLRQTGLKIVTTDVAVCDSLTGTTRVISAYRAAGVAE